MGDLGLCIYGNRPGCGPLFCIGRVVRATPHHLYMECFRCGFRWVVPGRLARSGYVPVNKWWLEGRTDDPYDTGPITPPRGGTGTVNPKKGAGSHGTD